MKSENKGFRGLEIPLDAYEEIAQIVGKTHITRDRGMMASYAWNTGATGKVTGRSKYAKNWPLAVVLPGDSNQVAAVIKCCLRHGIGFKAHSTGYGTMSQVADDKTVCMDLRRLDHLEIDAKNRMAIIGPYVTAAQLQVEAFKHGLTCHIVGAGATHSPLASATSMLGIGITGNSTGMNGRNLLAWEWVTPTGEIVRGGSASQGQWFAGEGPGPGFRGMLRGFMGATGALGVFTRIGIKLYPWAGERIARNTGTLPQIGMEISEGCALYQAVWDTWEAHSDASLELTSSKVAFAMLRVPAVHMGTILTSCNAEYVNQLEEGTLPEAAREENNKCWTVLTTSFCTAEKAWKDHVVRQIVERTGGRLLNLKLTDEQMLARNLATSHYVPRVFRPASGVSTSVGILDAFHFIPKAMDAGAKILDGQGEKGGNLLPVGKEGYWLWPHEGRYLWGENIIHFDPASKASQAAAAYSTLKQFQIGFRDPPGVMGFGVGPIMDLQGKSFGAAQDYIRQLKQAVDPADAAISKEFVSTRIPKLLKTWLPLMEPLVLSNAALKIAARVISKTGM